MISARCLIDYNIACMLFSNYLGKATYNKSHGRRENGGALRMQEDHDAWRAAARSPCRANDDGESRARRDV